ncbi:hypothetical protein ACFLZ7_03080 [Nanoarchaeota archaeon]
MKKAQIDPMKIVILFIILAIVAAIVIYMFNTQAGKSKDIVDEQIGSLGDADGDGVATFLDKCPKTPKNEIALVDSKGCAPSEQTQE